MNETIKKDESKKAIIDPKISNYLGILLIMPIYMIFSIIKYILGLSLGNSAVVLLPILMYSPIIIGIIYLNKLYPKKSNLLLSIIIIIFIGIAINCYYDTYFGENVGFEAIGGFILWLINTGICKIFSCILYGKVVGWKKGLIFFGIYVLIVIASFFLGFWA